MEYFSLNNKRIAKNTILLYCRTLIIMLVSLYTSRVVLHVLGVEDYGIYNVVGGIVAMFSFITSTLGSASQRYIAYDLAQNNEERLRQTFSLIMLSYGIVALITLLLAEIIGVWFLNTHMNIPENRMVAANWVLQASIIGFILNIFTAPYMAVIIAHERMNVYAYLSILDAIIKLSSVYILKVVLYDSLILYAILMLLCTFIVTAIYRYYCKKQYNESVYVFYYDRNRLKEIISYTWWSMFGPIANVVRKQGVNILLNLFFGPAINAARAISYQINSAISSFISNFYTALRPQIIKNYSSGDEKRMRMLIHSSSKLSFYLLLLFATPIYFNVEKILELWLDSYPAYCVVFVRLILITSLIEVFNNPLVAGLIATGQIKKYQQIIGALYILNLPISAILLHIGYGPEITLYINMLLMIVSLLPRLFLCKKYYGLNISEYVMSVLLRCGIVACISCVTALIINSHLILIDNIGWVYELALSFISIMITTIMIAYLFGINKSEKIFVNTQINMFSRKIYRSLGKNE